MGSGAILLVSLYILLPVATNAGVIRQKRDLDDDTTLTCLTQTLKSIVQVDCSDKGLTELPDGIDKNVQVLVLSNNEFTSFPYQLEQFTKLQVLDFSNNQLSTPLPFFLGQLENLSTLILSGNNYDVWLQSNLPKLKKLDLSKNKINKIDDNAFNAMPQLNILNLAENRIHELTPKLFFGAKNLEELDLCRNYFSKFPRFHSNSLKSLHLNNCQITDLTQDSLSEMTSLLELYLALNEIEMIPDEFASNTLQELDLSYNNIELLTDNSFSSLPHLAVLDMRGNDFKEIWPTSHFASNPFLREVHVKGNRWSCDGFDLNLLLTYEFFTKEPAKVTDKGSLICYSPGNVTQMSWQQAYIRTWHPNNDTAMSYTTAAVLVGVIIGVVVTSCICRGLSSFNNTEPPRQTTVLNLNGTTPLSVSEASVVRVPLRDDDLPPSYDEALLMPRLNASFHSLPDFIDQEEENRNRDHRRSRSIGDLTEFRPRTHDRRSIRPALRINCNANDNIS
ncbi:hypothetical protein ACJJTC_010202 [Scirpophaga incertulas]